MAITKQQVQDGTRVRVNNPNVGARKYDPLHGHEGTIRPAAGTQVYDARIDSTWVVFEHPIVYNDGKDTCEASWMYLSNLEAL